MRYVFSEIASAVAVGRFTTGATVTILVYNKATGVAETLTSAACTEIGTTGFFTWDWSNLVTAPIAFTEYLWIMSDGAGAERAEEVIFGGYPDDIKAALIGAEGANAVTISIIDQFAAAIPSVGVQIYDATNTTLLSSKTTNASGQVVFNLNDGSYKVRLIKNQVTFAATEDLTVSGATADTYTGEILAIPVSTAPNVCRVFSYALNQSGQGAVQSLVATAVITSLPFNPGGGYHVGDKIQATFATGTGQFYWDLPYTAVVQFRVDSHGIQGSATIPSVGTQDLNGLTLA